MRVPTDAAPGKAVIRLELPKDSGLASVRTDIPIEVTAQDKPR